LLGLLNLEIPDAVEGVDLSHCALGQWGLEPEATLLQGMGTTAAWQDGHEWRALRTKRHTYARYRRDGQELCFDHLADPYQLEDLSKDPWHAPTVASLRQMLEARLAALGDTFEACTWYRDHWTEDRVIVQSATLDQGAENA
jgi:hypothetical protein